MDVMLGVRDITNTSATLDWIVPDDKPFVGFKVGSKQNHSNTSITVALIIFCIQISCKGYTNNPALNGFNFDELNGEEADLVEYEAPRDARQLLIDQLVPDYNYSCSLLAAELDVKDPELSYTWTSMIQPIQFSTLSTSPPGKNRESDKSCISFQNNNTCIIVLIQQ